MKWLRDQVGVQLQAQSLPRLDLVTPVRREVYMARGGSEVKFARQRGRGWGKGSPAA